MAIFDRLDRMTSARVDRTFAVAATIDGMTRSPNGRGQTDPDRMGIAAKGVLETQPAYAAIEIGKRERTGNDTRTLVHGADFSLSVDRARYPRVDEVKQGDRITLDDTRRFEVLATEPDGMTRVVLALVGR